MTFDIVAILLQDLFCQAFRLSNQLGLTLASATEERGRVYRIATPASV